MAFNPVPGEADNATMLAEVALHSEDFSTDWAQRFAADMRGRSWGFLSDAQRDKVKELYEELFEKGEV